MKKCNSCGDYKNKDEFYTSKTYKYTNKRYLDSVCKLCRNSKKRVKKESKQEKIKKWNKKFKEIWKNERS